MTRNETFSCVVCTLWSPLSLGLCQKHTDGLERSTAAADVQGPTSFSLSDHLSLYMAVCVLCCRRSSVVSSAEAALGSAPPAGALISVMISFP